MKKSLCIHGLPSYICTIGACGSTPPTRLPDGSGCFTATILSKEEAMKLPPEHRPLNCRMSSELYHKVWESIGEASMCWKPKPLTEVFQAEQASKIATALCLKIADELDQARALTKQEPAPFIPPMHKPTVYCEDPDNCAYADCPTAFCDKGAKRPAPATTTPDQPMRFQSELSGLWYENIHAAGTISAVEWKGKKIIRREDEPIRDWLDRTEKWARELTQPTEPGYYWMQRLPDGPWQIVVVEHFRGGLHFAQFHWTTWKPVSNHPEIKWGPRIPRLVG